MKAKIALGLLALLSCGNVELTEGEKLNFDRRANEIKVWSIHCTFHVDAGNGQEYRYPVIRGVMTGDQALCEQSLKMLLWSQTSRYVYDTKSSYTDCTCGDGSYQSLAKDLPCPYTMPLR